MRDAFGKEVGVDDIIVVVDGGSGRAQYLSKQQVVKLTKTGVSHMMVGGTDRSYPNHSKSARFVVVEKAYGEG